MIEKIQKITNNISIEVKTIFGIIIFTIFIVGLERYQISQSITEQFIKSKKSKNQLLVSTILPVVSLNMSLGLDDANKEYLDYVAKQYSDLEFMEIKDTNQNIVYKYGKYEKVQHYMKEEYLDFCVKNITDTVTNEVIGSIHMHFSDKDYQEILSKSRNTTIKVMITAFILLLIFISLIKNEFKYLQQLTSNVLEYDPKLNNFPLEELHRRDEVGVINNAIVTMVKKIATHTHELDEINLSLEEKIKMRTKELEDVNEKLKALSVTDELTQLSNRRYFEEYFHKTWELAKRNKANLSLIMCDIDLFKKVNDTYGHQAGDYILQSISKIMKKFLKRETDFVARYGGEEFVIVLYDTDANTAKELCQNIQEGLKKQGEFEFKGENIGEITLSFGISSIVPHIGDSSEGLLKLSDRALYKAKENGRNRIEQS